MGWQREERVSGQSCVSFVVTVRRVVSVSCCNVRSLFLLLLLDSIGKWEAAELVCEALSDHCGSRAPASTA
jgi:hypothetical protein